jgi:acyl carrier protein
MEMAMPKLPDTKTIIERRVHDLVHHLRDTLRIYNRDRRTRGHEQIELDEIMVALATVSGLVAQDSVDLRIEKFLAEKKQERQTLMEDDVTRRVIRVISEQLRIHEGEIKLETRLAGDLGADSIDQVELIMALETEFDLEDVDPEQAERMVSVWDVVKYMKANSKEEHELEKQSPGCEEA